MVSMHITPENGLQSITSAPSQNAAAFATGDHDLFLYPKEFVSYIWLATRMVLEAHEGWWDSFLLLSIPIYGGMKLLGILLIDITLTTICTLSSRIFLHKPRINNWPILRFTKYLF
jgi:hypothetical protein